jgi:hypothetical protein
LVKCGYSSKGGNITKDELTEWVNGQINQQQEVENIYYGNLVLKKSVIHSSVYLKSFCPPYSYSFKDTVKPEN